MNLSLKTITSVLAIISELFVRHKLISDLETGVILVGFGINWEKPKVAVISFFLRQGKSEVDPRLSLLTNKIQGLWDRKSVV